MTCATPRRNRPGAGSGDLSGPYWPVLPREPPWGARAINGWRGNLNSEGSCRASIDGLGRV